MSDTVQRIFQLMEQRHVSAYRVSQETGISQARISGWKTGKSNPKQDALEQLADYFGVSVDYLLGKTDKKEGPASETENKPFQDEFIAFYGDVKDELTEDDIEDLKTFMRIRAEIKKQKEK